MKTFILFLFITLCSLSFADTFIVVADGEVRAFIDSQNGTIYLWDGRPTAYLTMSAPNKVQLKEGESHIYGFNGLHLGWYYQGHFLDHEKKVTGMVDSVYEGLTKKVGNQGLKRHRPYRQIQRLAPFYKINTSDQWSNTSLVNFLLNGRP
ncbi:MAG: hypothetical protein VYD54_12660 [Bdellovibrionota bacterium]|nr:hypothetical protein [Bdellovibrionota bacterium]